VLQGIFAASLVESAEKDIICGAIVVNQAAY